MKYALGIWFVICSVFSQLYGQETPAEPEILLVTVDIETQNATIVWQASSTPDITDYYLVYLVSLGNDGYEDGREISPQIAPSTNYFTITGDDHLNESTGYSVVAVNGAGAGYPATRSNWTTVHTVFLQAAFDSCLANISLSWNDYDAWRGSIASYNIYRYMGPGIYELLSTVPEGTNFLNLSGLQPSQGYDLFVEAVHNDGRKTTSNRIVVSTDMSQIPAFVNADFATLGPGNHIDLSFTVDGSSGMSDYKLLRSQGFDGPFLPIDSFSTADSKIRYTDDEITFTSSVQFYRLEVINNCGIAALQSNRANNIILNGSLIDLNATLNWNEYRDWAGNVEQYRIIRTIGRKNPVTDTLSGSLATNFNENVGQFINYENPSEGLVCYSVMATENTNLYGIQGTSESNQLCFSINTNVRIPNAFIPNDAEAANRIFEPVFSFLPEHYEMIIYNRLGLKIWEGSQAWDGRVNGEYVTEGVYVYYLRVFNYSSEITAFNGKVTVIYR